MNRMFLRKFGFFATSSLLALVVACGSGGGGLSAAEATAGSLTSALAAIAANPSNYDSFMALVDANYKQDGFTSDISFNPRVTFLCAIGGFSMFWTVSRFVNMVV